jgi:carboxyl-terminal processing protease
MRHETVRRLGAAAVLAAACFAVHAPPCTAELTKYQREHSRMMLKIIRADLEKYYYDQTFHGVSLDEAFKAANEGIDRANSVSDTFMAIARPLFLLDDSHTFFVPPGRAARLAYGWEVQMVGDTCYVTAVQEGSDAEAKGLKRGDQIIELDGDRPTRDTLQMLFYVHRALAPQEVMALTIAHPGGPPLTVKIAAKVTLKKMVTNLSSTIDLNEITRERQDEAYLGRQQLETLGEDVLIWKLRGFNLSADEIRTGAMRQIRKRKHLILDFRGNSGGWEETLQALVGGLVGGKTKIGDLKGRKPHPPLMARKVGDPYEGTIIALVDSESRSAPELLARILQLTGRAKILGDRTPGAVMRSEWFQHMIGDKDGVVFATSVTVADLVMTDSKSLERVGVTPDEVILPTPEDLAAGRDPVLSRAAALCGVSLTPEAAGAMFPVEWHR